VASYWRVSGSECRIRERAALEFGIWTPTKKSGFNLPKYLEAAYPRAIRNAGRLGLIDFDLTPIVIVNDVMETPEPLRVS